MESDTVRAFPPDHTLRNMAGGRPIGASRRHRECPMRLARLVAAGLALGAVAGFVGALLRPRSVHTYHPEALVEHSAVTTRRDATVQVAPRTADGEATIAPPARSTLSEPGVEDQADSDPGTPGHPRESDALHDREASPRPQRTVVRVADEAAPVPTR